MKILMTTLKRSNNTKLMEENAMLVRMDFVIVKSNRRREGEMNEEEK